MKFLSAAKRFSGAFTLLLLASLLLSVCGNAGSSARAAAQKTTVAGIAAAGAPLAGKVHLSDSSFKPYSTNSFRIYSSSSPINQDGSFSIDTTRMKKPFVLRATDAAGKPLYYSFAEKPGIANINPLTNLALAKAAGNTSLDELYSKHTGIETVSKAIGGALSDIMKWLKDLLTCYHAETSDPLSGPYQVNNQGLDGLFDEVSFTVSDVGVNIATRDTQSLTIYDGLLATMTSGALIYLPAPKTYQTPGNAELTMRIKGNLPQGALIKNVSFSVQLPLGITVNLDSSDPKGLTSVVNTAFPVGSAKGSNVYPPPVLSSTNNILTVSMSSPAGFGVGNFIKIRCIVSSDYIMAGTTSRSFTVIKSILCADIYKNNKLKGLTIVPVQFKKL